MKRVVQAKETPRHHGILGPRGRRASSSSRQVVQRAVAHHELRWFYFNGNLFWFHFYLHLEIKINVFSWKITLVFSTSHVHFRCFFATERVGGCRWCFVFVSFDRKYGQILIQFKHSVWNRMNRMSKQNRHRLMDTENRLTAVGGGGA